VIGRIGEEAVGIISNVGKQAFRATSTSRLRYPDAAVRFVNKFIFAECKNVWWFGQTSKVPLRITQIKDFVKIGTNQGVGKLQMFVNSRSYDAIAAQLAGAKIGGSVKLVTFEKVLGVKINAWVQGLVLRGSCCRVVRGWL